MRSPLIISPQSIVNIPMESIIGFRGITSRGLPITTRKGIETGATIGKIDHGRRFVIRISSLTCKAEEGMEGMEATEEEEITVVTVVTDTNEDRFTVRMLTTQSSITGSLLDSSSSSSSSIFEQT